MKAGFYLPTYSLSHVVIVLKLLPVQDSLWLVRDCTCGPKLSSFRGIYDRLSANIAHHPDWARQFGIIPYYAHSYFSSCQWLAPIYHTLWFR